VSCGAGHVLVTGAAGPATTNVGDRPLTSE